ncbi:hypothetical protein GCM10010502_27720 [Kitasatospora aureofaciens]|uniref:Uncharacterized protein n=1 Tax=Kitasatospora aureofaciens TaxID=1894 RepID=A0A8H9HLZ7_KITAU|nr:hypothetical protein GCM10010502_27720 [Kitasatospora aureofaciens]
MRPSSHPAPPTARQLNPRTGPPPASLAPRLPPGPGPPGAGAPGSGTLSPGPGTRVNTEPGGIVRGGR